MMMGAVFAASAAFWGQPPALPTKDDLCRLVGSRPVCGAVESVYQCDQKLNIFIAGYHAESGSWYVIKHTGIFGVDTDGKPYRRSPGKQSLVDRDAFGDESVDLEQWISPQILARKVCEMDDLPAEVEAWGDGGLAATFELPVGQRWHIRHPLPEGAFFSNVRLTLFVDASGLVTHIRRTSHGPIEALEYIPESLSTVPVVTSFQRTEAVRLRGYRFREFEPGSERRFTREAVLQRSKRPSGAPSRVQRQESTPDKVALDERVLREQGIRTSGPWYAFDRLRWPMLIAGVVLVTLGVVAYVRQRR